MPGVYSPSQSPSSLYSHAPTVVHHSAHRSALARRATRQLKNWAESPTSSATHDNLSDSSPYTNNRKPTQADAYSYNGNYNTDYTNRYDYADDYARENDEDDTAYAGSVEPVSTVQSGPTVRKYSDFNFDDEDETIGFAQVGRREKIGGEWGTPESALAGIGRQATRMMRAAATKKGNQKENGGVGLGLGLNVGGILGGNNGYTGIKKTSQNTSPSGSVDSRGSARQRFGDFLPTSMTGKRGKDREFLTSGSKVSIESDQSRDTSTSNETRTSSSESSVGEAVITPNHSSAFTPYHETSFSSTVKESYPTRYATARYKTSRSRDDNTPTLAPSAQIYDPVTNSNTLNPSPALFTLSPTPSNFAASDRPLMSSGSPGFGLITLEAAQERERVRLGGPTPKNVSRKESTQTTQTTPRLPAVPTIPATQSQKIKNKKSLISLFKSATGYATNNGPSSAPPVPGFSMVTGGSGKKVQIGEPMPLIRPPGETSTPAQVQVENWENKSRRDQASRVDNAITDRDPDVNSSDNRFLLPGPKLELRPVSMTFANGLPEDYLATTSPSDTDSIMQDGRSSVFTASSSLTSATSSAGAPLGEGMDDADVNEVQALKREIANLKKTHQFQQSELSSQLREMKDRLLASEAEIEEIRTEKERWAPREDGCTECGCTCGMAVSEMLMGSAPSPRPSGPSPNVGGGRARSGTTTRSVRSVRSTKSAHSARNDYAAIPVPNVPIPERTPVQRAGGVMDRGRVKTGGARGVFGTGSLYEWE